VAAPDACPEAAGALARRLATGVQADPPRAGLYLWLATDALSLCQASGPAMCMRAEFIGGTPGYRSARQRHQREAIVRACGITRESHPWVVDATAGLGRDAFVLATAGATVTLLERSPVVHALLVDGLQRAAAADADTPTTRMHPRPVDAVDWLRNHGAPPGPAAVYLDPMYTGRRRGAAGKELALLQALLPPPMDESALLIAARAAATDRVVVKRHRLALPLAGEPPDYQLPGRSTRFDVYRADNP